MAKHLPTKQRDLNRPQTASRRKIVDVFYVQPILNQQISPQLWKEYQADLTRYHQWVRQGKQSDVQRDLTYRFAAGMLLLEPGKKTDQIPTLYPIKLEVDNESSPDCTVLRIDALDTTGFLFRVYKCAGIERNLY